MPSVFICYRREDTAPYAGWLRQDLATALGKDRVFMDIDTIAPGADFEEVIQTTLDRVDAVLVMIGPKWTTVADSSNLRRLDNPDDYIRLEVATGLKRRIRVIPILVGGAAAPRRDQLPEDLQSLARRQAIELSETRWEYDTSRLIESLKQLDVERIATTPPQSSPLPTPLPAVTDVKSQPREGVDRAPTLTAAPVEPAPPSATPLRVGTDATEPIGQIWGKAPEVTPIFPEIWGKRPLETGDLSHTDPVARFAVPEPGSVSERPVDTGSASHINVPAKVSSETFTAAPTFAYLIGAEEDKVEWRVAILFIVAVTVGQFFWSAVFDSDSDFDFHSGVFRRLLTGDLLSAALAGCLAIAFFRYLPSLGASIVVGAAQALLGTVLFLFQFGHESPSVSWGSTSIGCLGLIAYYASTSWSVRKFDSVVIAPVVSGAAAAMIFVVVDVINDRYRPLYLIAAGALQGLIVGAALFFARHWRASQELKSTTETT